MKMRYKHKLWMQGFLIALLLLAFGGVEIINAILKLAGKKVIVGPSSNGG